MSEQTFPKYQGEPGAQYGYTLPDGSAREIKADKDGVVTPDHPADVAFLESHGLTLATGAQGLHAMKKDAIVEIASNMGLDTKGTKDALIERIEAADTSTSLVSTNVGSTESDEEKEKAAAEDAASTSEG